MKKMIMDVIVGNRLELLVIILNILKLKIQLSKISMNFGQLVHSEGYRILLRIAKDKPSASVLLRMD